MAIPEVEQWSVVQLDPSRTKNPMFAGCFMTVTEIRSWGVIGYVQSLGIDGEPGGAAYYRAETGTYAALDNGRAVWSME